MVRKSDVYLVYVALNALCLIALTTLYPVLTAKSSAEKMSEASRLVRELELTDLALFTEARYTRHITQTDLHSPFQDHPISFEHFPSGSIVFPPYSMRVSDEKVD